MILLYYNNVKGLGMGKRKANDMGMMGKKELLHKIRSINTHNTKRDRALVALTYLLGARISEIIGMKEEGKWKYEPITLEQLEEETFENQRFLVIKRVPAIKRRKNTVIYRNIPISYEKNTELIEIIGAYADTLNDGDYLFNITRQRAWQIIKDNLGLFCHYFRHLRSSHLVEHDGFTEGDLMRFHGWSSPSMGATYVHLDWRHLARKQA